MLLYIHKCFSVKSVNFYSNFRYIPHAAALGGLLVALLSLLADVMGAWGSGTSLIMAVGAVTELTKTFAEEQKEALGASFFSL